MKATAYVLAMLEAFKSHRPQVMSISSHSVASPAEHETWSKRDMQRMKGKKARLNRGKNRGKHENH